MPPTEPAAPEATPGNPTPDQQAPAAPETTPASTGQAETPEYFDEKFDPATLPEQLRPAYHQMRNAFTGKTQTIAQERQELRQAKEVYDALQDPEKRIEALQHLGIIDDGALLEGDDLFGDDPNTELTQRLEALEAERQLERQTAQEAQVEQAKVAWTNHGLAELVEQTGREFSDDEIQAIGEMAQVMLDGEGLPDVRAAYERIYTRIVPAELERLKQSKDSDLPPLGTPPSDDLDFDNPGTREDFLDARAAQLQAGQG